MNFDHYFYFLFIPLQKLLVPFGDLKEESFNLSVEKSIQAVSQGSTFPYVENVDFLPPND